jgi:hypothetical protein
VTAVLASLVAQQTTAPHRPGAAFGPRDTSFSELLEPIAPVFGRRRIPAIAVL